MRVRILITAVLVILVPITFAHAQDKCKEAKNLYNIALKTRDTDKAMGLYRKAISLGCTDPKFLGYSHNNLGDILERRKDLYGALKEYREAERYIPEHMTVVENIARVLQELGREQEAKVYYDKLYLFKKNIGPKRIVSALSLRGHFRTIMVVPPDSSTKPEAQVPSSSISGSPVHTTTVAAPYKPEVSLPSITLYFDFDSSYLRPSSVAQLRVLLKAFKDPEIMDHRFLLAGHTCSLGTEEYNMGLSIRRAMSVKEWLVAHGIDSERLIVRGFGETRPIMSNRWEHTRRFNRRVEIKTIGIEIAATRGNATSEFARARELLKQGQNLIAMGRCKEAIEPLEKVINLLEKGNSYYALKIAKQNLALAYLCIGDATMARKVLEGRR